MTDIVMRLHEATLDKDNMPRMDSERQVSVGLAKEAKAEIERLRSEGCAPGQCRYGREILAEKDAEIERLRAALQRIADYDGPRSQWIEELARRALEPKP